MAFNIFAKMKFKPYIFLWVLFFASNSIVYAQKDSAIGIDTVQKKPSAAALSDSLQKAVNDSLKIDSLKKDSIKMLVIVPVKPLIDSTTYQQYMVHPYLPMDKKPISMLIDYKTINSKDFLFYLVLGVVFLLAFIKLVFPKFFRNLFMLFFQTSLRQKQTREQLLQDSWAGLLVNVLFFLSSGLFVTLLTKFKGWSNIPFWNLYGYITSLIVFIYIGKFIFISFAGWVFNNREAAQSYVFLVSMVNRIMGILLIPFTIFLAFANQQILSIVVTLSLGLVLLLFLYRYLVSFGSLRNDLKINPFHFFIYLCSVEIIPMLLIYKLLVNYIG
jgi:hypothetical protein